MAQRYSNEEKYDMLVVYIQCHRNAGAAGNSYFENYPDRPQPHRTYFQKLTSNLLNFGSFEQPRGKYYGINNQQRDRDVIQAVNVGPSSSTREISQRTDISKSTVQRVLKKNKFRPYKPSIVQGLKENDFNRRLIFCHWFIQKCRDNQIFSNRVLWTDETRFTNCGIFNRHNHHHWSVENPHLTSQRRLQTRFGFNVWCGILGLI